MPSKVTKRSLRRRVRTAGRRLCVSFLGLLLACETACYEASEKWNVLVIVPDTIRADHLSINGYSKATSPALDALARHGTNFTNAITVAPRTWQSFSSILTGLYPPRHGVRFIYDDPIAPQIPTMAKIFTELEYDTIAFDTIPFLAGMTGRQGFDRYVLADRDRGQENMDGTLLDQVWETISASQERPFLAFVRLGGAHWPYTNDSFIREFEDGTNQDHSFNRGSYGLDHAEDERFVLVDTEARRQLMWSPEEHAHNLEHMAAHYDAEIREVDSLVGRLIARMRDVGLDDTTIVVVTSDHGESLGEQGYMQHGPRLDDSVMHVPLIFRLPRRHPDSNPGSSYDGVVRVVDILPTLLDAVGASAPSTIDGVSLLPAIRGEAFPELWAYGETGQSFMEVDEERHFEGIRGKQRMIRTRDWKLIWIPHPSEEIYRLYDLREDPKESHDVAETNPDVVALLRGHLDQILSEEEAPYQRGPLSPEELETLRTLGYVR